MVGRRRQFFNLSAALENGVPCVPPDLGPRVDYIDHRTDAEHLSRIRPRLSAADSSNRKGWYYASTMNRGERAIQIDEVPLDERLWHGNVVEIEVEGIDVLCTRSRQ